MYSIRFKGVEPIPWLFVRPFVHARVHARARRRRSTDDARARGRLPSNDRVDVRVRVARACAWPRGAREDVDVQRGRAADALDEVRARAFELVRRGASDVVR